MKVTRTKFGNLLDFAEIAAVAVAKGENGSTRTKHLLRNCGSGVVATFASITTSCLLDGAERPEPKLPAEITKIKGSLQRCTGLGPRLSRAHATAPCRL